MNAEVDGSLADYLGVAERFFSTRKNIGGDGSRLRDSLEQLEKTTEFVVLARSTARALKLSESEVPILQGVTGERARTFLRLSGVYTQLAGGGIAPAQEVYEQYCNAFQANSSKITYLAPLELIELSRDSIDFGQFQIRRFSSEELDNLFRNNIRQSFYPEAALDSWVLMDYWFLVGQETIPRSLIGSAFDNWDSILSARIGISYSGHPPAVQLGMRHLALFNWGSPLGDLPTEPRPAKRERWEGPFLPPIPFVIRLSDSLLDRPTKPRNVDVLLTEPIIDSSTGEEEGETPARVIFMDDDETDQFQRSLRRTTELMTAIEPYRTEWKFIDTALDFLLKAYTTEGLEQLLWHITAIEAILGQKVEAGLTALLLSRTSNILGTTVNERRDFKKRFDELYSFRSALVHGNADLGDKKIYRSHLSEARDFARCIVVWMLSYLAQVSKGLGTASVPSRERMINLIDLDLEARDHAARILRELPTEFPNVRDWLF